MPSEKMCDFPTCYARPGTLVNGLCEHHRVHPGQVYQHYKGGIYSVLAVARTEDTQEKVVVYRQVDGPPKFWTRPLHEFIGEKEYGLPRFVKISDETVVSSPETRLRKLQAACRVALAHQDPAGEVSLGFQDELAAALRESEGVGWAPPPDLNPGIRETVIWLRGYGFHTSDSGDGKTHMMEGDAPFPYVSIRVDPKDLLHESHRLHDILQRQLVRVGYVPGGPKAFDGEIPKMPPRVESSYTPGDRLGLIMLVDADDVLLGLSRGGGSCA